MSKFRLDYLAQAVGAHCQGDPALEVDRIDTLADAGPGAIAFLNNARYRRQLASTRATAVIVSPADSDLCPVTALLHDNPYLCYARIASILHPPEVFTQGVHSSAVVSPSASIGEGCWIGACCVIGDGVQIGKNVFVGPGCVVEKGVQIGDGSRLLARVTLCHDVVIGREVLVHPGAVVGSDGFGLAQDGNTWIKIPQIGRVVVGDCVEIGANTTIDRGAIRDTVIERGVKMDNQIQIAHNVQIGENTAIAGCVGISGSTVVGRNCTLGGGVGLAGHLHFGDNTHFTGQSLVTRSFEEPGVYSGNLPAMTNREWRKMVARLRQLEGMARRLRRLERRLEVGRESDPDDDPQSG